MKKIKRIVFCAERPDKGPSGGAAGVMYLLRKYADTSRCDCTVQYMYRDDTRSHFVKTLIKECIQRKDTYYICHEPDSASILALFRKRYSLVYHQQGPIIQEYLNHEEHPTKFKIAKKRFIERMAFTKADRIFFPSGGAANEYFNSEHATVKRNQVSLGSPLYNTINLDEDIIPIAGIERNDNVLTVLSVGTMSELKGQDLSYDFISTLVAKSTNRIRWITVGDGLIKNKIVSLCAELSAKYHNFEHIHFDKIPHGSVLYLDQISDVYIMLHRSSIFDLATLEAMKNKCAIILSNIGGNLDFNAEDNIVLVDPDNIEFSVDKFLASDINWLKQKNEQVFDEYFSPEKFGERYINLISDILSSDNKAVV